MDLLLYLAGVLAVVVGVIASIALHEVGHLVPAKLFGVKVTQYMVGFGRTVFSRRRGETEYGLKAIPLGGYISMIGMYPPTRPGEAPRESTTGLLQQVDEGRPRRRAFDGLVQEARDASAETIGAGEDARSFYRLPVPKRIVIMLGGPLMNLLIAVVLFGVVLSGFGAPAASTTVQAVNECALPASSERTTCEPGDPASPAAEAGILPGDRIVSVDGVEVDDWAASTALIRERPDETVPLVVERDGEELQLSVTPMRSAQPRIDDDGLIVRGEGGEPDLVEVGFVGMTSVEELRREPLTAVLPAVGDNVVAIGRVIVTLPQRVGDVVVRTATGQERDPDGPMSIVGVGRLAGEVASFDEVPVAGRVASVLQLLASLNVALFVFNMIPLMPLDGGHILVALWEGLRRRLAALFKRPDPGPVDAARLVPVTLTVAVIIGVIGAVLIVADLVNPIRLG